MLRFVVLLLLALGGCASPPDAEAAAPRLVLCGGDEVFVVDLQGRKSWGWRAVEDPALPDAFRPLFRSTDECKPTADGRVVITSSGGAAAVVDRATRRATFWARVVNAHSAELLPRNRLAAAASVGQGGDRLLLFDLARPGDPPLWSDALPSGHGVVWDADRGLLWALGGEELRAYLLEAWDGSAPRLTRLETHRLPSPGGHDLSPVPFSSRLLVTTGTEVLSFDRETRRFEPHPRLGKAAKVKGISVDPRTGRTAYVQAEESWWAFGVRFLEPDGRLNLPGRRLYKARWLTD